MGRQKKMEQLKGFTDRKELPVVKKGSRKSFSLEGTKFRAN